MVKKSIKVIAVLSSLILLFSLVAVLVFNPNSFLNENVVLSGKEDIDFTEVEKEVYSARCSRARENTEIPIHSAGGDGLDSPIVIMNVHELQDISNDLSAHYVLGADIDASETVGWNGGAGFAPLGTDTDNSFTGTLDGNNHTITDLYIDRPDAGNVGMFGYVGDSGIVCNVGLKDADVSSGTYNCIGTLVGRNRGTVSNSWATGHVYGGYRVGGLVGQNEPGTVIDSHAAVEVNAEDGRIGGLVGFNVDGIVSHSYATGDVTGGWYVGGLVGRNYGGTIEYSFATGSVNGGSCVGGLSGDNEEGTVTDSYATGDVFGSSWAVGGLMGYVWGCSVTNTYSTGSVDGDSETGGLIGYRVGGSVTSSFWDTETSGMDTSSGGVGKTTEEMMTLSTFAEAGWDIAHVQDHEDEIWYIDQDNDYPRLWWEEYVEPITFDIPLFAGGEAEGWNFVSFNLVPVNTDITAILADIEDNFDRLMYYDASFNAWSSYVPGRVEHYDQLQSWNHTMGIWILMNTDDVLTITGTAPVSTDITLRPGWNMVGLPSESAGNHGLPVEITKIGYFDAAEEYNLAYTEGVDVFEFQPGQGYWVYNEVSHSVIWTVEY